MREFKQFLKRKYGGYIRAWRLGFSPYGSVVMQQTQFLKACVSMGWRKQNKLLWQAFDKDGSGYVSFDELDLHSAEVLAECRRFILERFGSAAEAFRVLDSDGSKRLVEAEFIQGMTSLGFSRSLKLLFRGLCMDSGKAVLESDFEFLDTWRPLPFLTVSANQRAKEEVLEMLIEHSNSYLAAWMRLLDKDGSNCCSWEEFKYCCQKIGYSGDVPGAWRAFDDDLSGFITLHEIDADASNCLQNFKGWADREFGGVRAAYSVFDTDGSNSISFKEWTRCCRIFNYAANSSELFRALDVERKGILSFKEVTWLDDWLFYDDTLDGPAGRYSDLPTRRRRSACGNADDLLAVTGEDAGRGKTNLGEKCVQLPALRLPERPASERQRRQKEDPAAPASPFREAVSLGAIYGAPPYALGANFEGWGAPGIQRRRAGAGPPFARKPAMPTLDQLLPQSGVCRHLPSLRGALGPAASMTY